MRLSIKVYCIEEIHVGRCFVVEEDEKYMFKKTSDRSVFSFYHNMDKVWDSKDYEGVRELKCLRLILPEKKINSRFEILDIRK